MTRKLMGTSKKDTDAIFESPVLRPSENFFSVSSECVFSIEETQSGQPALSEYSGNGNCTSFASHARIITGPNGEKLVPSAPQRYEDSALIPLQVGHHVIVIHRVYTTEQRTRSKYNIWIYEVCKSNTGSSSEEFNFKKINFFGGAESWHGSQYKSVDRWHHPLNPKLKGAIFAGIRMTFWDRKSSDPRPCYYAQS
jgi:hypothetical protein